jgi:hypothetical protein
MRASVAGILTMIVTIATGHVPRAALGQGWMGARAEGVTIELEPVLGDDDHVGTYAAENLDDGPVVGDSHIQEGPPSAYFGEPVRPHPEDEYGQPWDWSPNSIWPPTYCWEVLDWLGLRRSETFGRHVGLGAPFVGTSWLNRPYYAGAELGTLWIMRSQDDHVSRDTDIIGGVFVGCDWDHYWGSELRFQWATPELINSAAPDADRTDSLFAWSGSLMYYPWGDAKFRPYWRLGLGGTRFDFPTETGDRRDAWLVTMPFGVGLKYPLRPWLAARVEFADNFSIGGDGLPTQHNLMLNFALECRFGAHPRSYWPWNPSRHIW